MGPSCLTLSGFSFTATNRLVGRVVSIGKDVAPNVTLVGESKNWVELGPDNTVWIKEAAAINSQITWVEVVLESGNGKQSTYRIVRDEFHRHPVIAHRGAWKNTGTPENSIAALQQAIELGCAGSEFDVHLSADEGLFVHHDYEINGLPLETTPAAVLSNLKLANGEKLPTLEAYLQAGIQQNHTKLILEMKPSSLSKARNQVLAQKVVEAVRALKAQGWVEYISFDYEILKKVQELEPSARLSYLNGEKVPAELAQDKLYGLDYHHSVLKQNPHWIEEAHSLNLIVNSWTVNTPEMMDWLLERNADFITTNEPELLLEKVMNRREK